MDKPIEGQGLQEVKWAGLPVWLCDRYDKLRALEVNYDVPDHALWNQAFFERVDLIDRKSKEYTEGILERLEAFNNLPWYKRLLTKV